jgi:hypothetical protein
MANSGQVILRPMDGDMQGAEIYMDEHAVGASAIKGI